MISSPVVINKIRSVVFSDEEPLYTSGVLWGKKDENDNYVLYAANFSTSISLNSFHRRMPLMYRGILDPTENLS